MIHKKTILFIAITILCCSLFFFTIHAWGEETVIQSNRQFMTYVENGEDLVVYDLQKNESFKLSMGCAISNVEICSNYPFVSFACTKENQKAYFLYDLEKRKVYEGQFYLDISEHRWPPSGEYTYFNKETSFLIVHTKKLRLFLQATKNKQKYIEIIGHPLGLISQVAWIGDNILYRTGVGEMECWGFLEVTKKENYFISCCGVAKDNLCNKKDRQDESVIKLFISKVEKGSLKKISTDFYNDTLTRGFTH